MDTWVGNLLVYESKYIVIVSRKHKIIGCDFILLIF